jgi:Icc-related predicted phosphoesterase
MRILHISDTHGYHDYLKIKEKDVDMIIHSGDYSNSRNPEYNFIETMKFLEWYENLNIKYKILISGNHDSYDDLIGKNGFNEECKNRRIIYLQDESTCIEGITIYGSPYTHEFGSWYFQLPKNKMKDKWENIDPETNILVTHGPPIYILDKAGFKEPVNFAGCQHLANKIKTLKNLKYCMFGHIHNNGIFKNSGYYKDSNTGIIYSNASCVTDRQFESKKTTSHGNYFIYS